MTQDHQVEDWRQLFLRWDGVYHSAKALPNLNGKAELMEGLEKLRDKMPGPGAEHDEELYKSLNSQLIGFRDAIRAKISH